MRRLGMNAACNCTGYGLPVVECMRLGMAGLRTGSSTLTGEEKSEQARPSELMGTDPLLTECSLESKIQERSSAVQTQNSLILK